MRWPARSDMERFLGKTVPGKNGCILWTMTLYGGYGRFKVRGKNIFAHIYIYEATHGPVPAGKELDHICRVKSCVNVAHLRAITHKENVLCGEGVTSVNAKKTHCIHGHELTPENLYLSSLEKFKMRQCRECTRIRAKNYHQANLEKVKARMEQWRKRNPDYDKNRRMKKKEATQNCVSGTA